MFGLSIVVSVIFLLLVKKFPKCMVYTMIVLTILLLIALIIFGIIKSNWWLVIVCGIFLLVTIIALACCWKKLKIGIKLLEAAA